MSRAFAYHRRTSLPRHSEALEHSRHSLLKQPNAAQLISTKLAANKQPENQQLGAMCNQQLIQFCSSSAKYLLYAGSCATLLLALLLGYHACTSNSLFQDIETESISKQRGYMYHVQLGASAYLLLVTLLGSFAGYSDNKHTIRALAIVSSVNFVLALAAAFMLPSGHELSRAFNGTLTEAMTLYDFKAQPVVLEPSPPPVLAADSLGRVMNSTLRQTRDLKPDKEANKMTAEKATKMWDLLQARGCCGLTNSTDWQTLPKSCCSNPVNATDHKVKCDKPDGGHSMGCLALISSTGTSLMVVLLLVALANFYMALVSSTNTYWTLHYDEASQTAYT